MRFFLRYLSLEGKKSLIAARKSMVKFIVMLLLIAGGVLAVSLVMKDAGVFQTAEIGVVIPEDEAQTKMVAQFISAMDSVKSVCHFQYLNQDKAMASLEKGTLDAVLSLPEQFYEDVDSGKNTPATIYFPENAPLNTRVFGELVTDGVSLLRTAGAGCLCCLRYCADLSDGDLKESDRGCDLRALYLRGIRPHFGFPEKCVFFAWKSRPPSILFFCGCFAPLSDDGGQLRLSVSEAEPCCGGKNQNLRYRRRKKCIDQSASYDRSAVACGSFGVCCGLSGIREVSSVFFVV